MRGCSNCRYCKCYPGDYWTPDDYECTSYDLLSTVPEEELDEVLTRVWENGEEWADDGAPLCPCWEEVEPIYD